MIDPKFKGLNMPKVYIISIIITSVTLLTGCTTLMSGTYQKITVSTDPAGALCSLHNDKGNWGLNTPGSVTIKRTVSDLYVSCFLPGYMMNVKTISGREAYPSSIWMSLLPQGSYIQSQAQ